MHHQNKDFKFFLGFSVLLHILLFIIVNFEFTPKTINEEQAIAIDFLEIEEKSNVVNQTKLSEKKDLPKEKPQESYQKPAEPKKPEQKKPIEQKKEEPKPVEKQKIPEQEIIKEKKEIQDEEKNTNPEIANTTKPQEKKVEKSKSDQMKELDDLESMLKNLDKKTSEHKKGDNEMRGSGNENMKMAYTDFDAIVSQIEKHWNLSHITGKDGNKIRIVLKVELSEQGFVENIEVVKTICQNQDRLCMIATENAIRAVQISSPFQFLKREHYKYWRSIVITFDPAHVQ